MFKTLRKALFGKESGMNNVRHVAIGFDVTAQIAPEDVSGLAQQGYTTVICMRPDNEGASQPAFAAMQAAAEKAGIEAVYLPVVPGQMTEDQARMLKQVLSKAHGPVLAYCASGNRCAAAYEMAKRV